HLYQGPSLMRRIFPDCVNIVSDPVMLSIGITKALIVLLEVYICGGSTPWYCRHGQGRPRCNSLDSTDFGESQRPSHTRGRIADTIERLSIGPIRLSTCIVVHGGPDLSASPLPTAHVVCVVPSLVDQLQS